jgi:hypothetical protein
MEAKANSMKADVRNEDVAPVASKPNLKDPAVILELLEADQVVAAKQQTRFGARNLSPGLRALLFGLRVYVLVMIVVVAISVIQAAHATP